MGYKCGSCGKYARADAGPCNHCGAAKGSENQGATCPACNKPTALKGQPCADCKKVCCSECSKPIAATEYIFVKDTLYHRSCYNRDIPCQYCNGPILGPLKHVLDANYHPKCFICTGCSKALGDNPFHEIKGWPFCPDCFSGAELKQKKTGEDEKAREERLAKMRAIEEAIKKARFEVEFGTGGGFVVDPKTVEKRYHTKEVK